MWETTLFGFTIYQLFWYFCIYSVVGWCTEVVFCTVNTGKWVNRGFLNGPVCPIYGFGMIIILCVLHPLADRFLLLFLGGALLASALELMTGWVLEKLFHTHWWDYSHMPFNIGGYICLKFSLAWGLGCVLAVRALHPLVASLVDIVPPLAGEILAWPVLLLFLTDTVVTASSIVRLNRDMGKMEEIAKALRKQSDVISHTLGDTALDVSARLVDAKEGISDKLEDAKGGLSGKLVDAREDLSLAKSNLAEKLDEARAGMAVAKDELVGKAAAVTARGKEEALARRDELQARYDALFARQWAARRLSRAFPAMRYSGKHTEAFAALLEKLSRK